jgi:hypothetical protein
LASTDHFWYRPQPEGIFVDSQRDNKAFGFADGKVLLSEDNGRTWPHSIAFPDARHIVFSCILQNGNVLFSALAKLYLSTDNLRTYRQITVKNADGTDYLPHTPQNPAHPGWYFHSLTGVNTWDVNGVEMLVWGNYCNVIGGAAPGQYLLLDRSGPDREDRLFRSARIRTTGTTAPGAEARPARRWATRTIRSSAATFTTWLQPGRRRLLRLYG